MTTPQNDGVELPPESQSEDSGFLISAAASGSPHEPIHPVPVTPDSLVLDPAPSQANTDTAMPAFAQDPGADDDFQLKPPNRMEVPTAPIDPAASVAKGSPLTNLPKVEGATRTQRVVLDRSMVAEHEAPVQEEVGFPSTVASRTGAIFADIPNFAPQPGAASALSRDDARWIAAAQEGGSLYQVNEGFEDALSREGSLWGQGVMHGNRHLRGSIPKFKAPENAIVAGPEAVRLAMSYFSLGDFVAAPLWSSGFWVVFQPMPDTAWIELNRLLGAEDIRLGRDTYGLVHANTTSLTVETIVNFLLPYVYSTTVDPKQMSVADLPKYLSMQDIPSFIWGFIWANYPKGFKIERSCLMDPSKCRDVAVETLAVGDMQIVDRTALDDYHLNHMAQRQSGAMSLESVIEYQKRLRTNLEETVDLKNSQGKVATFSFHVPSADSQFLAANRYIESLKTAVLRTVTRDVPTAARDKLMGEYMTATEMCLYDHLVKTIEWDGMQVNKIEDIDRLLALLTRDSVMRANFFEAAAKFLDKSVTALVGIKAYKCPKCGADHSQHNADHPEFSDFIPLDLVQLFSHLAEFRTRLIQART